MPRQGSGISAGAGLIKAKAESEIDAAFATLAERSARALLVAGDTFFNSRRDQLAKLAARFAVPAIYEFREYAAAGGLISYASRLTDAYYQAGLYLCSRAAVRVARRRALAISILPKRYPRDFQVLPH
jgi:hypothetical protein